MTFNRKLHMLKTFNFQWCQTADYLAIYPKYKALSLYVLSMCYQATSLKKTLSTLALQSNEV